MRSSFVAAVLAIVGVALISSSPVHAEVCDVRPVPLDKVDLAAKPTELKFEMTSTSRRTRVNHSAFHLIGEGDTEVLSLFGIGFHVTGRTLAYACIKIDEDRPQDDRIEVLFHSVNNQQIVHRSPLAVTWEPLQPAHSIVDRLFGWIPFVSTINDALSVVTNSLHDHLRAAVSKLKTTGVDRVVVTRDAIELSVGVSLLGGSINRTLGADIHPFVYRIPLEATAEQPE